jgi:hypothetical protein
MGKIIEKLIAYILLIMVAVQWYPRLFHNTPVSGTTILLTFIVFWIFWDLRLDRIQELEEKVKELEEKNK